MNWYPWLNAHYHQLVEQHILGRGHHALLIHALRGNGKNALIYGLSRWLLCQKRQGKKSCGQCHSCHLMLAGHHPDCHLFKIKENQRNLGIDSIRQVIEKLSHHPQQGGARVISIPNVHDLTIAAVNALLKTLEEPPKNTYFLLGCHTPSVLMPTLKSRCFCWRLFNPPTNLTLTWLAEKTGADPILVSTALKLSSGAPLSALSLLQKDRWNERVFFCLTLSDVLSRQNFLALLPQLNHDNIEDTLHWLISLLLDALKYHHGITFSMINEDQQPLVEKLATLFSISGLFKILRQSIYCRHQLLSIVGINKELLLTEQLLNFENALNEL